jgi:hypothetical protein
VSGRYGMHIEYTVYGPEGYADCTFSARRFRNAPREGIMRTIMRRFILPLVLLAVFVSFLGVSAHGALITDSSTFSAFSVTYDQSVWGHSSSRSRLTLLRRLCQFLNSVSGHSS